MSRQPKQLPLFAEEKISMSAVAKRLGTSVSTVRRLLEEGKLMGYQLRKRGWWTVLFASVVAFEANIRPDNYNPDAGSKE